MAQLIQFRRGTAAAWTLANPVLASGEIGFETDTNLYKIGNGVDNWSELYYGGLNPELGVITFEAVSSEPSVPSAGSLRLYAKSIGGRILPKILGPSGVDTILQPSFFSNGIQCYLPGTSSTPQAIGGPALTSVGTISHPALTTTNLRTQTSRFNVLSGAAANSAAEARSSFLRVWRGDVAGLGGFFVRMRFAIVSAVANQRSFFGFTSSTSAIATTQETRALTNMFGIGNGLGETTLRTYQNDGSGNATETNLGVNFPANDSTMVYDLTIFANPNDDRIYWQITNLTNGEVATGEWLEIDLPISTTFLTWHCYMNNGGTAAAVNFDVMRIYTETDY